MLQQTNALHCKCLQGFFGVSVGVPCSMKQGCKNHKETLYSSKEILCMLWENPVIFTDCRENPINYSQRNPMEKTNIFMKIFYVSS